jgi:hypothetical protein
MRQRTAAQVYSDGSVFILDLQRLAPEETGPSNGRISAASPPIPGPLE